MPIIVVLLLAAACARVPWPTPPFGLGARGSLLLTTCAFLLPISVSIVLSRWVSATVQHYPDRRREVAMQYTRWRRWLGHATLAIAAVAIAGLGWGHTVWHRVQIETSRGPILAPLAELLVPAPYLLCLFAVWLIHYDAERSLHHGSVDAGRPFFSRLHHFLQYLRPFAVMVLLPLTLVATQQSVIRLFPQAAAHPLAQATAVLLVVGMFILMPLLMKPALGLRPLPPSPQRTRLEAVAQRLQFRYADLLIWPTHGLMTNAMVVGVVPRVRYVVFTDRLLESLTPDQLDAVFGHELGHVKHGHIPYYALFILLSATVTTALANLLVSQAVAGSLIEPATGEGWLALLALGLLGLHIYVVFGWLSRLCERQADLFGCRVASGGSAITPHGVTAMIQALERVADLNGLDLPHRQATLTRWQRLRGTMRAWMHGTIADRVRYLRGIAEHPEAEGAFQWRVFAVRCTIVALLLLALAGLGNWIGWEELLS